MKNPIYKRSCPICGKIKIYKNKISWDRALCKNTMCAKCSSVHSLEKNNFNRGKNKTLKNPKNDLSGKMYKNWQVIKISHRSDKENQPGIWYWDVKCTNCGYETKRITACITKSNGCIKCRMKPTGEVGLNCLFNNYIYSSKKRNLEFLLTKNEVKEITSSNCYYCGTSPNNIEQRENTWGTYKYNGIDRLDNEKGYYLENCVPCCETCNRGKNSMKLEKWLQYISILSQNITHGNSQCIKNKNYPTL